MSNYLARLDQVIADCAAIRNSIHDIRYASTVMESHRGCMCETILFRIGNQECKGWLYGRNSLFGLGMCDEDNRDIVVTAILNGDTVKLGDYHGQSQPISHC